MDILEKKQMNEFNDDVKVLLKKLKLDKTPISVNGSYSLKSSKYYSDIDLFQFVDKSYNSKKLYDKLIQILNDVFSNADNIFVELKLQLKNDDKIKYERLIDFEYSKFKKVYDEIDYIKVDLIKRIKNKFIEVSIIYKLSDEVMTTENYIKSLNDDIAQYTKEKKYFKVLKRKFNLYKLDKNYSKMKQLIDILNSDIGHKYQLISNLEAIKKLLEITDDKDIIKKIIINLKDNKMEPDVAKLDYMIDTLNDEINKEAKIINNHF